MSGEIVPSEIATPPPPSIPTPPDGQKYATDEEVVQGLQTAAGFAECIVKQLYSKALHKSLEELFGDEQCDRIGAVRFEPIEGSGVAGFTLKLDLVDKTYRVDVKQFKEQTHVLNEMVRLIGACETYWQFCKKTYNLPNISLWRSDFGTVYVAGAPDTLPHIGIKITTF